jgi:glucosyl-dolichyl phosphate glucuronosyltransferase
MHITVAICTWNRADLLDQTLSAMHELRQLADLEWELLVVNNNCTDHTDEVLSRHARGLPLRRVFEPVPGLSNARNCAVAAAAGDLVVWTDDDVLVDPAWLSAYRVAAQAHPAASFFGGPITPWFEGEPPRWLREHWPLVASAYAVRDFGDVPVRLSHCTLPFGANFAVRTPVLRRYPFDPALGFRPDTRIPGEETALIRQVLDDGHTGWWVPEARVRHFLPRERQTTRYLWQYYAGKGEEWSLTAGNSGSHWFGKPRWMWRELVAAGVRYYGRRGWAPPEIWLNDLKHYAVRYGLLRRYENPS